MTALRRFVKPRRSVEPHRSVKPPAASAPAPAVDGDRAEHCEMCGAAAGDRHGHVADTEQRSILCTCRPCYLLFAGGNGRFRGVPERYLHDPAHPVTDAEWDRLGIPVGSAFFLRRDADGARAGDADGGNAGGTVAPAAFSPSPVGATEYVVDPTVWADLCTQHPLLAAAEPEVEAILIRSTGDGVVDCYLVPIDACYRLVGTVRLYWKGFDGGEARPKIDEFFDGIRARAAVHEPARP